ncbi:unnamed protein product, partial [Arabidopsis halleri]
WAGISLPESTITQRFYRDLNNTQALYKSSLTFSLFPCFPKNKDNAYTLFL